MSSLERRPWEDLAEAIVRQAVEDYKTLKQGKPLVSIPRKREVTINGEVVTVEIPRREWMKSVQQSIKRSMREIEFFFKSDLFRSMCGEIDGKDVIKRIKSMDVKEIKRKKDEHPVCPFGRKDCFAWLKDGKCWCLEDTEFLTDECPFYKTEDSVSNFIMLQKEREEDGDE